MRKLRPDGVVLHLSHVSGLFTSSSFEPTPTQDGIRGVDLKQRSSGVFEIIPLHSRTGRGGSGAQ